MSTNQQPTPVLQAPFSLYLAQSLSETAQTTIASLVGLLSVNTINDVQFIDSFAPINSVQPINEVESINDTQSSNGAKITGSYLNATHLNSNYGQKTSAIYIKNIVDGRGLACPMPLLKTKVALREVAVGEALYVVATDPNSQADIVAFCQQTQQANTAHRLLLVVNKTTASLVDDSSSTPRFDTIFHFIITKTDSN